MSEAITTPTLVQRLQESRLLTEEQLDKIGPAHQDAEPEALIERILAAKWLTPYQAKAVATGNLPVWAGPFELLQLIARGRSGWVFQARKPGEPTISTLKLFPRNTFANAEDLARWRRESRAISAMRHPALATVREIGGDRQQLWMVREYIEGHDLSTVLRKHGPLPIDWACEIARQMALGLQHGYLHGFHHGHLQPGKVMVLGEDFQQTPQIKLLGLGFSYATWNHGGDHTVTGPEQLPSGASYLAPEIALGAQPVGIRSDLYSLGVVLFEMLTGRLPWPGKDSLSIWNARFELAARPATKYRKDVPLQLSGLLERLLARDPKRRLRTPGELAAALLLFCPENLSDIGDASQPALYLFDGEDPGSVDPNAASSLLPETGLAPSANVERIKQEWTKPLPDERPEAASTTQMTASESVIEAKRSAAQSQPVTRSLLTDDPPEVPESPVSIPATANLDPQAQELIRRLGQTDLLTPDLIEQLSTLAGLQGRELVDWFVLVEQAEAAGLLTRWQADQVMAGRKEFRLGDFLLLSPRPNTDGTLPFIALHPKHGAVLVKLLPMQNVLDQEILSRLDREGRVAQEVQHPHVLRCLGRGRSGQIEYLALESVEGPSLAQVLEENGSMPEPWCCEVARQVADALSDLAAKGIVHRSVSPSNILLTSADLTTPPHVKLTGLGQVQTADDELKGTCVTQAEEFLGDADYVAPEQVRDAADVDHRADLYSLGCVLFHLVSGEVPFPGASPQERADIRLRTDAPKLTWVQPKASLDLEPIVTRLMERNPDRRFPNAQEVAAALKPLALAEGLPPLPKRSLSDLQAASGVHLQPQALADLGDLDGFFSRLRDSKLLNEEKLSQARKLADGLTAPQLYANRLVDRGLLTRWQANRLLENGTGFFIQGYALQSRLSQGPLTETFLAEKPAEHIGDEPIRVVIKLLNASGVDKDDIARFQRCGRTIMQIKSSRIVPVESMDQDAGRWYQLMPYVPGRSAMEILRRLVRLQVGWACEIARQVALGLADLAKEGVVHRDIQPANILVPFEREPNESPTVRLLGFGILRNTGPRGQGSTVTRTGDLIGTADYIAPEQAEDPVAADTRADIYALGCTLYQLLTGQLPFDGPNAMARLTARFGGQVPKAKAHRSEVPEALDALLAKMMALNPAQRMADPLEVAKALEEFAKPLPNNLAILKRAGAAKTRERSSSSSILPPIQSVSELLERVEQLAILGTDSLRQAREQLSSVADLTAAGRLLLSEKLLTPWQIRQLILGRQEFFVGPYRLLGRMTVDERTMSLANDDPRELAGTFLAADTSGHVVVVRRFAGLTEDPPILAYFETSKGSASALEHPGLAKIVDAGHLGEGAYVVWERVAGRNLEAILDGLPSGHGMPIESACAIAHQVATALDHAQRLGVLHRNLRPSSLMIRIPEGDGPQVPVVQVLDLGVDDASRHWTGQASQALHGSGFRPKISLDYLAPELLDDAVSVEPSADVYALATILYRMLTGRLPFEGGEAVERVTARLASQPPHASTLRAEIPRELATLVARGLASDTRKRYQNLGDMARDLARFAPSQFSNDPGTPAAAPKSAAPLPAVEQFLTLLDSCHLLSRDQIDPYRRILGEFESSRTFADRLVAEGKLTRWQATQLLNGHRDFYLGTYQLLSCLGHGSSGTVYEAQDQLHNRVALKVLAPEHLDEAENIKRFLREGRVAKALVHPNICAVHASETDGDRHFLVMELCQGQDLKHWVSEYGPLPVNFACECIRQAALALDYARQSGVVHRDIKPGNLVVSADDVTNYPNVKITDLGVADITDGEIKGTTVTKMNEILGTPDFMAPEQAQDPSRADSRCDLYSLGCTLYYLLTGEPPFAGETPVAKLTARFKSDAPSVRLKRPDVPMELESIVAKMLQRDPARRHQTAGEVARELEPFGMEMPSIHGSMSVAFTAPEVEQFYATLHRADLLPTDRLHMLRKIAVQERDPRMVAKGLVEDGAISRWQARQLLEGRIEFRLGDYALMDLIGRGATGFVYKARTPGNQIVALKVLSNDLLKKPEALARFRREMRVVAELNHPNVVTAYDCGQIGDDYFIAMEHVAGRDLKTWLAQHGPLPVEWACDCIRQAAAGLQHAYSKGIVHRDIKPGNMLVVAKSIYDPPTCKILDMGFANAASRDLKRSPLTRADQLLGTPDYMSPEQAQDPTQADIRSDIYSLGCTLFRLITGRPPFNGETPLDKLNARFRHDAPLLRTLRPDAPPELELIVAKMLSRNPQDRYQQPAEVYRALKPFCLSDTVDSPLDEVSGGVTELDEASIIQAEVVSFRNKLAVTVGTTALVGSSFLYLFTAGDHSGMLASVSIALIGLAAVGTLFLVGHGEDDDSGIIRPRVKRSGSTGDFDTVVNLLSQIHPEQDAMDAPWALSRTGLVSPPDPYARLQLPTVLPENYALRMVVERIQGDAALTIGLVVGGRQCLVTLDGWGGTTGGLGLIAGRSYETNATTFKGRIFTNNQPSEVLCIVFGGRVEVIVDGDSIFHHEGPAEELTLPTGWHVADPQAGFLGSHATQYRFYEVELLVQQHEEILEIVEDDVAPSDQESGELATH